MLPLVIIPRLIGFLIFLAGLVVLVRDALVWGDVGRWVPIGLGQAWHDVDRSSLDLAQAMVEHYTFSALWNPVITGLLSLWTFAVLMFVGVVILVASGSSRRPSRR